MARIIKYIDDFSKTEHDNPEDVPTRYFAVADVAYRADLSEENHSKLIEAMQPFIEVAEEIGHVDLSTPPKKKTAQPTLYDQLDGRAAQTIRDGKRPKEDTQKIRAWAQGEGARQLAAMGITVGDKGALKKGVVEAYNDTHQES